MLGRYVFLIILFLMSSMVVPDGLASSGTGIQLAQASKSRLDGDWIGKISVNDGGEYGCIANLKIVSATVADGRLKLTLSNFDRIVTLDGAIDDAGNFSVWRNLEAEHVKKHTTSSHPFKFSGNFDGDRFDGGFYAAGEGSPGAIECTGDILLARVGSDAHRNLANPSTSKSTNKFDGIWQISLRAAGGNYSGCPLGTDTQFEVKNGQANGSANGFDYRVIVDGLGRVTGEASNVDGVGIFEGTVEDDTGTGSVKSDNCEYEVTAKRMKSTGPIFKRADPAKRMKPIEPFAKRIEPAKPPASKIVKSPGTGRSIKARLQKLKTLLDKNLITKEKAAQKRREILKDL